MTHLLDNLLSSAKKRTKINVAVINPVTEVCLLGAISAEKEGLIKPYLIGDKSKIISLAEKLKLNLKNCEIIDSISEEEILKQMVLLANSGTMHAIMKADINTGNLLKEVIKKENNLREEGVIMSHIFAIGVKSYHKPFFLTDAAINIAPTVEQKEKILQNALDYLLKIGITSPKVAALSASEKVSPKMQSSIDAEAIAKKFHEKCTIEGPLAFDNIISKEAAEIKHMKSDVAGDVDLILAPNIETANTLFKALVYLAHAEVAGLVLGAKLPVILTSRADNERARLLSCALAVLSSNS